MRPSLPRRSFLAAGAAALALLSGGRPAARLAGRAIRVGTSLSLSGVWAADGHHMLLGYRLWEEQVNAEGGLLGRPVQLLVLDDASRAEGARRRYLELLDEHRVDLLLGPYGSVPTSGALEVLEARRRPCAMPLAASPALWSRPRSWCVQVTPSAARYMDGPLTLATRRGARRLAVIYLDTGFTRDVALGMVDKARELGLSVTSVQSFPDEAGADYENLLKAAARHGPDIVAGGGYLEAAVRLTRAAHRLGLDAAMWLWMEGPHRFPWGWLMGAEGDGVSSAGLWSRHMPTPEAQAFVEAFRQRYGLPEPGAAVAPPERGEALFLDEALNHESAAGYAAARITQRAVEAAGSLDPVAIRDALFQLRLSTAYGFYQVDAAGAQVGKAVLGSQWVGGQQRLIWPEELSTGPLVYPVEPWSRRL